MKIAQIAPLIESVPPRLYGGTERVVSYLTEELVEMGHDVTLFASGDSLTKADLVPAVERALRLSDPKEDPVLRYLSMMDEIAARVDEFDILHFHIDGFQFPLLRSHAARTVTTLHGRQDLPSLRGFYRRFAEFPLVSISDHQRRPLPGANFVATIYHGLPPTLLQPHQQPSGDYLAFLGRISPEKGVERAIEIAKRTNLPLKIAAKVDPVDEAYFREAVQPLINHPNISFIGEIDERQKARFLGNARAFLFPIDWPEPFGMVMIEAMACGSPILAFNAGSVPEVIDQGVSGVIVETVDEAVQQLPRVLGMDRKAVRAAFDRRFTSRRMANDYVELFTSMIAADLVTGTTVQRTSDTPVIGGSAVGRLTGRVMS